MASVKKVSIEQEFDEFRSEIYSRLSGVEISTPTSKLSIDFASGSGEAYRFRNTSGAEAKDLHIEFDKSSVEPVGKGPWGPFSKWSHDGVKVDLKKGKIANGDTTEAITFVHPRSKDFKIVKWWWTNGAGVMIDKEEKGDSADLDPA